MKMLKTVHRVVAEFTKRFWYITDIHRYTKQIMIFDDEKKQMHTVVTTCKLWLLLKISEFLEDRKR